MRPMAFASAAAFLLIPGDHLCPVPSAVPLLDLVWEASVGGKETCNGVVYIT